MTVPLFMFLLHSTGMYNPHYCLSYLCIDCSLFTLFVFYNWYLQLSILLVILYIYILTAPLFTFPIFIQLVPTTLNIAYYLINIDCSAIYIFCLYQQVPTIHTRDYHYQQNVWPVHLACIVINLDYLLLLEIVPLVTCV
jgi:hypothetical protein